MSRNTVALVAPLVLGMCAVLGPAASVSAGVLSDQTLEDDFDRADNNTSLGVSSVGGRTWKMLDENGLPHSVTDALRITDNQLHVGNDDPFDYDVNGPISGTGTQGESDAHAELGPFPNDVAISFDLDFGPITGPLDTLQHIFDGNDPDRWGIETIVSIRRPANADWNGADSARSPGVVAVHFFPNGKMELRTTGTDDGTLGGTPLANYADRIFWDKDGTQIGSRDENGDPTGDVAPNVPVDQITGSRNVEMSIVGDVLRIAIDGEFLLSHTINPLVPTLTENYIALGKDLRSSSGFDARYSPRFDNLTVDEAGEGELELEINTASGFIRLVNTSDEFDSVPIDYYEIVSPAGALDADNWNSLDEQNYDANGSGPGQSWDEAGGADEGVLSEAFLAGNTALAPGGKLSLGRGYGSSTADAGLTFTYRRDDFEEILAGNVHYIVPGDMDNDGDVDEFDVPLFVQALVNRPTYELAQPDVDADFVGDFDGNGLLDTGDIAQFSQAVTNAASASAGSSAVPEPASVLLVTLATCCFVGLNRHQRDQRRPMKN